MKRGLNVILLTRGQGWDPVIKRGGLGSSYQEGRVGNQLTGLTPPHFCACSKPGPGFPMSYVDKKTKDNMNIDSTVTGSGSS
jgi:hypothetical protein